jgi:enoyl-CoA hydratase
MAEKSNPLIYYEEDQVAHIEINRPQKKNALNFDCWQLFDQYFENLKSSSQIRALVITGHSEDIFSAGVDVTPTDKFIAGMFEAIQNRDKIQIAEGFASIQKVVSKLTLLPFPTIAALNGPCYSGAVELAAACDIRVIKAGAVICLQETRMGLIPDLGGTVRLARLVGPGRAKDLIFTARKVLPEEALALGLVNQIFPKENFRAHVSEYVKRITANAPGALQAVKEIIETTSVLSVDEALAVERDRAADNVLNNQCVEGISAFLEKRDPKWDLPI